MEPVAFFGASGGPGVLTEGSATDGSVTEGVFTVGSVTEGVWTVGAVPEAVPEEDFVSPEVLLLSVLEAPVLSVEFTEELPVSAELLVFVELSVFAELPLISD